MTKEQEEAIDYVQKQIDYFKEQIKFIEAVYSDYYEEEYELYKNRTKQFSTALNLIQEQQEENKKKDKIIDYMIDWIRERSIYAVDSHDMLKQYFERKVEDGN